MEENYTPMEPHLLIERIAQEVTDFHALDLRVQTL